MSPFSGMGLYVIEHLYRPATLAAQARTAAQRRAGDADFTPLVITAKLRVSGEPAG